MESHRRRMVRAESIVITTTVLASKQNKLAIMIMDTLSNMALENTANTPMIIFMTKTAT